MIIYDKIFDQILKMVIGLEVQKIGRSNTYEATND